MTIWTPIYSEINPIAPYYTNVWAQTCFEADMPPTLPANAAALFKSTIAPNMSGLVLLRLNISVPAGHEVDPSNTSVFIDATFGLDPAIYPANVQPQIWGAIIIGAITVGGILFDVFKPKNKAAITNTTGGGSAATTSDTSGIGNMLNMIMPIMMLSMLMPMMTNMMPKN